MPHINYETKIIILLDVMWWCEIKFSLVITYHLKKNGTLQKKDSELIFLKKTK